MAPVAESDREAAKEALLANRPVSINETVLKLDTSNAFITAGNPQGCFVHAQNHLGVVCAASTTVCDSGLNEAIRWAENQLNDPEQ